MSDCVFCGIVSGNIPSKKIYEDEHVLAFYDIQPKAPFHVLIIPKKHISSLAQATEADRELLGRIALVSQHIAKEHNIPGYKLLTNVNKEGGQVVFHVHTHMLAGGKIDISAC